LRRSLSLSALYCGTLNDKNQELAILSSTDALTGLSNRLSIENLLEAEIIRKKRYKQSLSVLLLDIDNFKSINDQHGHLEGDTVLSHLAKILQQTTRETDLIGRWGGEEFLIILPETNAAMAYRIAEKLRTAIAAEPFSTVDHITGSFGLAEAQEQQSPRQLLQIADEALYRAKEKGRNCVMSAAAE
jgi:polar amino acid transport system substrate-binding protein